MTKAAIYCRVSTKEQVSNLSLPTQKKACLDYCRKNGFDIDKVFVEEGESAKMTDRPQFQNLLSYRRENKGRIHHVVIYAINRFARNSFDHAVVRAYLQRLGVTLRSVTEPVDDSSTGKLMENILAAFSQFDNDVRAERTVAGMKAALERGKWTFQAPLGYAKLPKESYSGGLVLDPERGPLVRQAFELYATGCYSRKQVLNRVTSLGLRTRKGKRLTPQSFSKTLRNPIYAGWLVVPRWNIQQQGGFTPIVDEEIFQRIQAVLSGKRPAVTPHVQNHPDFPLRRFVRCAHCGKPFTGSWSKGRSKRYPYYRYPNPCCKGGNVRKGDLEQKFLGLLEKLQPKPEYVDLFKEVVLDVWKAKQANCIILRTTLESKSEEIGEQKNRLVEALVYRQSIDEDTYREQLDRLEEEKTRAQLELQDATLDELDVEAVLSFAEHVLLNAARL